MAPPAGQPQAFAYLDGAGIAARNIGEWARRSGFGDANVRTVTDERQNGAPNPVTRAHVQQAVDELFAEGAGPVDQLVLAFCGHGITDAHFGQISWLFTDSLQQKYRVVSEAFFAELLLHEIEHITLISDACREAPKTEDLMRLDPVRGIVVQGGRRDSRKFDRLVACQDGKQGFMVADAASAEPGKCVFSGVIADVLWGQEASALKDGVITTASFGACVRSRTAERARDYHLQLSPEVVVDPEALVLYDAANPPAGPAALQPWPPPQAPAVLQPAGVDIGGADDLLAAANSDPTFRERILGRDFNTGRHGVASSKFSLPDSSKGLLRDLVVMREVPESIPDPDAREKRIAEAVTQLERDVAVRARGRAADTVQQRLSGLRPGERHVGSNLIVSGDLPRIWSIEAVGLGRRTQSRVGWRVPVDDRGVPVLVEFRDGSFAPVVPYSNLYALLHREPTGDVFQAYGSQWGPPMLDRALSVIADFVAGRIGASEVDEFAASLRAGKHGDPVLGAICAYLYRSVADYDSIRRTAYFYVQAGQPIPFDVVLLADVPVEAGRDGHLTAHIPGVRRRERRPGQEHLPNYVTRATQEVSGPVGGRCPWLGLGWDYVGLAQAAAAPLVEHILPFARRMKRVAFTHLPPEAGRNLARRWGLRRHG